MNTSVLVLEDKPRWSILVRRRFPELHVRRTISMADTEQAIIESRAASTLVAVDLDRLDLQKLLTRLNRWQNCTKDPIIVTCMSRPSPLICDLLKDAGVARQFNGLHQFERLGKMIEMLE